MKVYVRVLVEVYTAEYLIETHSSYLSVHPNSVFVN